MPYHVKKYFSEILLSRNLQFGNTRNKCLSHLTIIVLDLTAMISIAACKDTWRLFHVAEDENLLHIAISGTFFPDLNLTSKITRLLPDLATTQKSAHFTPDTHSEPKFASGKGQVLVTFLYQKFKNGKGTSYYQIGNE